MINEFTLVGMAVLGGAFRVLRRAYRAVWKDRCREYQLPLCHPYQGGGDSGGSGDDRFASSSYQSPASIPRRTWIFLVLSAVATAASWLCYFRALSLGPVSRVAPIDKLSIVLVALLGVSFLGEHLLAWNWVGVAMVVVGVVLIGFRP